MSVFVNNISFQTTDEDFQALVSSKGFPGFISAQVSRRGNRSKGYGFVKFDTRPQALEAISGLNSLELDGRQLRAREARENANAETSLFVGNLPWDTTSEQVASVFSSFGAVQSEVQKQSSGRSKGFAIVEFETADAASKALAAIGSTLRFGDRPATVRFNQPSPPPRTSGTPTRPAKPAVAQEEGATRKREKKPRNKDKDSTETKPNNGALLYVGNLTWSVDDAELLSLFSGYKIVSGSVKKGYNGRSRGYGLVEAESPEEAQRIIDEQAEFEHQGRTVVVRLDRRP
eukprot:c39803_g1_i1.p1 GENE.c39803_g1_i1~~c39803_g1_i1.p1  ORF type:complete len:299 (-),score=59.34 c39803_g1_i1:101-964(-)